MIGSAPKSDSLASGYLSGVIDWLVSGRRSAGRAPGFSLCSCPAH